MGDATAALGVTGTVYTCIPSAQSKPALVRRVQGLLRDAHAPSSSVIARPTPRALIGNARGFQFVV